MKQITLKTIKEITGSESNNDLALLLLMGIDAEEQKCKAMGCNAFSKKYRDMCIKLHDALEETGYFKDVIAELNNMNTDN